jgi:hypothetical protein
MSDYSNFMELLNPEEIKDSYIKVDGDSEYRSVSIVAYDDNSPRGEAGYCSTVFMFVADTGKFAGVLSSSGVTLSHTSKSYEERLKKEEEEK